MRFRLRMWRAIGDDEIGNISNIVQDAVVVWCSVWTRIGGLKQFLAKDQGYPV
jgi:hypothetical protein